MAFFYVKNGLTAGTSDTGRYATEQTGSFPTTTGGYDDIRECFDLASANDVTNGDRICVRDDHTETTGANLNWNVSNNTVAPLEIISVSDTACDSYSRGASATVTGANDLIFSGRMAIWGLIATCGDDLRQGGDNCMILWVDSDLGVNGTSDTVQLSSDGCCWEMIDCDVRIQTGANMYLQSGCEFFMRGGTLHGGTDLLLNGFNNGGGKLVFEGVDLNDIDGYLLEGTGATNNADDLIDLQFYGCRLNSGVTFTSETLENRNHRLLLVNCGKTSAEAEYQYFYASHGCTLESETTIYRNESTAYPSGTKTSLKCITGSEITELDCFHFDFPAQISDFGDAAEDTITIYFASTTALDDRIWFDVIYPNVTNNHIYSYATSRPADILNPGSLTDDSGSSDWRDGVGAFTGNEYRVAISCPSGELGVPIIRAYVGIPSATIYFCTTIGKS